MDYSVVSTRTGELSSLLDLPPTQDITDSFRRRGFRHAGILADFSRLEHNLKQASEHYFDAAGALRLAVRVLGVRHKCRSRRLWRWRHQKPPPERGYSKSG